MLLLTDDGRLQARIADPRFKTPKTYLAQVEGDPAEAALEALRRGVRLKDGPTLPAEVERIDAPALWPRDPPVRVRKSIPDCWLRLTIREGRNRQVRRMTAAVGHPTLRLVRWRIGNWTLDDIAPGHWREAEASLDHRDRLLQESSISRDGDKRGSAVRMMSRATSWAAGTRYSIIASTVSRG